VFIAGELRQLPDVAVNTILKLWNRDQRGTHPEQVHDGLLIAKWAKHGIGGVGDAAVRGS
jgi:hypothetical protein